MVNVVISNLLIITAMVMICGRLLLPICATNSLQSLQTLSYKIQQTTPKEFLFDNSWNILRNSLRGDKNITLSNHPLPLHSTFKEFDTPSWQISQTPLEKKRRKVADNDDVLLDENVEIHNHFHYGINKSNLENNSYNNQKVPTSLWSNIKLANSSTPLPSSSYPRATTSSSTASSYFERVELQESLTHTKNEKLLLHRNKRYLLFPEGSSFQLVFDLIIPIVDYTNFAIMGITCAVAWELPSKPPSEIIENFRTKLNDGTFGLSRRNDSTQQQLEYVNSQRTEQEVIEDTKRWSEGVSGHNQHNPHQQLSATAKTTSGNENVLTNAPKPPLHPPSSNFNYYKNYFQREKFQQPATSPTTFFSSQHPQHQQWHNYNSKTFDTSQRKTLYANNNIKRPNYPNDFPAQTNKNNYYKDHRPADKWHGENWLRRKQQQPQQPKIPYSDAGDYWNKDNWWERNRNRIENHWQENQQKWSQYQENPQLNYQTPKFSRRTSRNRKILNKPPKHRIYPVFGKRRRRRSSAGHRAHPQHDELTKTLQYIHTREHLQTRQKLFGKIEKLYETRGQNGSACVLRALCQTERMHLHFNEAPQSFVMELLRSIFALPKDILTNSKLSSLHLGAHYADAALLAHDATQSCSRKYQECKYSITYDTR